MSESATISDGMISVEREGDLCVLNWTDGHKEGFHSLWLRDNCQCADCLHPQTRERLFDLMTLDPNSDLIDHLETQNGSLFVKWSDGHQSQFSERWLHEHAYGEDARQARREKPTLWTSEVKNSLPEINYEKVMSGDEGLLSFLDMLCDYGFALIRQTPTRDLEVTRVASRISFLRETNFGREFDVISKPNPNNVAYTALELQSHSDLPNWEVPPGTQFLHCLEFDAEGGESTLVDGFAAARQLQSMSPEDFDLLCQLRIPFRFHDSDWDIRRSATTLALDSFGELEEIRFHSALTAPLDIPSDKVLPFYQAYRALTEIIRKPENILKLKLRPGDLLVFNNRRALHGRAAFDPNTGPRHLQGCYVDNDDVMSKRRVLRRRL